MNILNSATKIVLLMVVFNLNIISSYSVIIGIHRGTLDPKDVLALFGSVVTGVIFFYFGKNIANTQGEKTTHTVSKEIPQETLG